MIFKIPNGTRTTSLAGLDQSSRRGKKRRDSGITPLTRGFDKYKLLVKSQQKHSFWLRESDTLKPLEILEVFWTMLSFPAVHTAARHTV